MSVTVIPALASKLLAGRHDRFQKIKSIPGLDGVARFIALLIVQFAIHATKNRKIALITVSSLITMSIAVIFLMMPKLDYQKVWKIRWSNTGHDLEC